MVKMGVAHTDGNVGRRERVSAAVIGQDGRLRPGGRVRNVGFSLVLARATTQRGSS